jgi:hypothetical protein
MFAAAALTLASEARAQANLHSGDVLRPGDNMIYPEVGWPYLAFGWQHGLSDKVDIGVKGSFFYGWEYTAGTALGLGVTVPIRITALKTGRVSLQIKIEPGLKFDNFGSNNVYGVGACIQVDRFGNCVRYAGGYYGGYYGYLGNDLLHFGLNLGLGLDVGIHINDKATITPGLEMPIFINFTNGVYGAIPVLIGAAFQYSINDNMSVGANLKLGPSILALGNNAYYNQYACGYVAPGIVASCGPPTPLGLIAIGFFAYKF